MTGREQKRLALLLVIEQMTVVLAARELAHPETRDALTADDARGVCRIVEGLLATMRRRAGRLRSVGGVR